MKQLTKNGVLVAADAAEEAGDEVFAKFLRDIVRSTMTDVDEGEECADWLVHVRRLLSQADREDEDIDEDLQVALVELAAQYEAMEGVARDINPFVDPVYDDPEEEEVTGYWVSGWLWIDGDEARAFVAGEDIE